MKKGQMKILRTLILILTSTWAFGQNAETSDFFEKIKNYDFSDLWTQGQFQIEGGPSTVLRPEPLGYIGENYQRFYIHFISVIQNPTDKAEYFVFGKTKVKDNVCSFQGTIKITSSRTYNKGEDPNLKQGYIQEQYEFFEDSDQKGTGVLKGKFRTDFYLDEKGILSYDALMFGADGFQNNQFEGKWTSYKSNTIKKCNWGDYRIPDSKELDGGAGEFAPSKKFLENGWQNYSQAWGYSPDKPQAQEAKNKELEKWWTKD
jgi:hypothetical protein